MTELVKKDGELIRHLAIPMVNDARFEWHPVTRKLYVVRGRPEIGTLIGENLGTEGTVKLAVLMWARGYQEGKKTALAPPPQPTGLAGWLPHLKAPFVGKK